ncbi:MAG TPA: ribonuclease P protein component [Candidatus Saccharimonadales bacterium]|nr:ribonuclease P protein component [Candidatus Saccharimonadales bacterium]
MLPSKLRLKLPPSWNRNYPDYKVNTTLFKLIAKKISAEGSCRVGFIISGKVGKAVLRNRLRRHLERLLQKELEEAKGSLEIIIILYPAAAKASNEEIRSSLNQALSKIHLQ